MLIRINGGVPASPSAPTAYDTIYLLKGAFEHGAQTPGEVYDYIISLEDYQGASNVLNFDEYGIVSQKDYFLKIIKDSEFVVLEE